MYVQAIRFRVAGEIDNFNLSYVFSIGSGIIFGSLALTTFFADDLRQTGNGLLLYIEETLRKQPKTLLFNFFKVWKGF